MDPNPTQSPFELLLRITGLLEVQARRTFQAWFPFLKDARWASGSRPLDQVQGGYGGRPSALPNLIASLTVNLAEQGLAHSDRILVFIVADWEQVETVLIESVLDLLMASHSEARIEVLLLHAEEAITLEIIMAAG